MSFLEGMIARRRSDVAAAFGPLTGADRERTAAAGRPLRDFTAALTHGASIAVIAEVKKASPSAGPIAPDADAGAAAVRYESGGAAAVSVLTEPSAFGGSFDDLADVATAVGLPVLAKDFVVDPVQLFVARGAGADAVLLMVSILGEGVADYLDLASTLGLQALVEVIDETELDVARRVGATLVAVNSRDLRTLEVDRQGAASTVRAAAAEGIAVVSASGIRSAGDVVAAAAAGADAVLIGETLMRAADPIAELEKLTGVSRPSKGVPGSRIRTT